MTPALDRVALVDVRAERIITTDMEPRLRGVDEQGDSAFLRASEIFAAARLDPTQRAGEGDSPSLELPELTVRPLQAQDVPGILAVSRANATHDRASPHWVRYSLGRGFGALVALVGAELVGYLWFVRGSDVVRGPANRRVATAVEHPHVVRYRIDLADDQAYMYDLVIAPAWRGRGLGRAMLRETEEQFILLGVNYVVAAVDARNAIARRMYRAAGWTELASLRGVRIARVLLRMEHGWYVRNSRRSAEDPVDFRPLTAHRHR